MKPNDQTFDIQQLELTIKRIRSLSGCVRVIPHIEETFATVSDSLKKTRLLTELIDKFEAYGIEELQTSPPYSMETKNLLRNYIEALTLRAGEYTDGGHDLAMGEADAMRGIEYSKAIGDRGQYSSSLNHLGNNLVVQGRMEQARSVFEESLSVDRELGNPGAVVRTLYNYARVEINLGNHPKAVKAVNEALEMYENDTSNSLPPYGEALLLNIRLDIHPYESTELAIQDAQKCLDILQKHNIHSIVPSIHFHLLLLYLHIDDAATARYHALQMVPEGQPQANLSHRLYQLSALAAVHIRLNDLEAASRYCREGLAIAEELDRVIPGETLLLERSAEVARLQGDIDLAEHLLRTNLEKEQEQTKRGMLWRSLASLLLDKGKLDEAEAALEKGMEISNHSFVGRDTAFYMIVKAKLLLLRGNPAEAIEICTTIAFSEKEALPNRIEATEYLTEVYELLGDHKQALECNRLHEKLVLEQTRKHAESRIAVLRSRFGTEQISQELKSLEEERDKARNKVKELSLQLAEKQKTLQEVQKEIQTAVSKLENRQQTDGASILRSVARTLDPAPVLNAQLMQHLHQVDEAFLIRLRKKHPAVTSSQERFCGLIRAGLSTSEIARILHVSPETVLTQRKRLRKKLNLKPSDNLEQMLAEV